MPIVGEGEPGGLYGTVYGLRDAKGTGEPESAYHRRLRAHLLQGLDRHEKAIAELDEAVRLEPGKANYHLSRDLTLRVMGRLDESLETIEHAIVMGRVLFAHTNQEL